MSAQGAGSPDLGPHTRHALCNLNSRCVIVDGTGTVIASLPFEDIGAFQHGQAIFQVATDRGVIDSDGQVLLQGSFEKLSVHRNGLIEAREYPDRHGGLSALIYFNRAGKLLRRFEDGENPWSGQSWASAVVVQGCVSNECTAMVLDHNAQTVAEFDLFVPLEGLDVAVASLDFKHRGLIDQQLAWRGRRDYSRIGVFNGILGAEREGGRTVLDTHGRELLPLANYRTIERLDTGEYMVLPDSRQPCLYFSAEGKSLPLFNGACVTGGGIELGYRTFSDHVVSYTGTLQGKALSPEMSGKLIALNRNSVLHAIPPPGAGTVSVDGEPQLPANYHFFHPFGVVEGKVLRDDLLIAKVATGFGVVDLRGRWRIAPRYSDVSVLSSTLVAALDENDDVQILDTGGRTLGTSDIFPPSHISLADGSSGFVIRARKRYGLLGEDGRWRVPPRYAEVSPVGGAVLVYQQAPAAAKATARFYDLAKRAERPQPLLTSASERTDGLIEGLGVDGLMHLLTAEGRILASLPAERPTYDTVDGPQHGPYAPPSPEALPENPLMPSPIPPRLPADPRAQQVKREFQAEPRAARQGGGCTNGPGALESARHACATAESSL